MSDTFTEDQATVLTATSFIGGLMTTVSAALAEVEDALLVTDAPPDTLSALAEFHDPLDSFGEALATWRNSVLPEPDESDPAIVAELEALAATSDDALGVDDDAYELSVLDQAIDAVAT